VKKLHLLPCETCRAAGAWRMPSIVKDPYGYHVECQCGKRSQTKPKGEFAADDWNSKQIRTKHIAQKV